MSQHLRRKFTRYTKYYHNSQSPSTYYWMKTGTYFAGNITKPNSVVSEMAHNSFYVTLLSDACMQQFPKNNAAEWTTKLKSVIPLPGQWEMALVEIQYPNSMYNLPSPQTLDVDQITSTDSNGVFVMERNTITVPAGIYEKSDIINFINGKVPRLKPFRDSAAEEQAAFQLELLATEPKLKVKFPSVRVFLDFPPSSLHLSRMLGFKERRFSAAQSEQYENFLMEKTNFASAATTLSDQLKALPELQLLETSITMTADKPVNMHIGNQSIFVYCNKCDYNIVGDKTMQLLRAFPIKASVPRFEIVSERFKDPHYLPVLYDRLDTIDINIATDLGEAAIFQTGKSMVKLHFWPIQYYYR
ncbi:uncharacterized protein LOC129592424 [Paramacrobiotus metropolitanus]|uniref:uncharacterized protein LOC129592424 n=1 Tax=Paramacrobiotus metropolitanus TaxID=2943436 RepID=UPI0024464B30|nr:uncharacterized protein LOC129592424 [Paramacrobiotus metropolitanus]